MRKKTTKERTSFKDFAETVGTLVIVISIMYLLGMAFMLGVRTIITLLSFI